MSQLDPVGSVCGPRGGHTKIGVQKGACAECAACGVPSTYGLFFELLLLTPTRATKAFNGYSRKYLNKFPLSDFIVLGIILDK